MFSDAQIATFVGTMVYTFFGIIVFGLTYWVVTKITPFSVRKEIEEDQNTALGIIIGSIIIGLAIVIGSAISG